VIKHYLLFESFRKLNFYFEFLLKLPRVYKTVMYGNKFYKVKTHNANIKLKFTLEVSNVKRYEGGEYGLTFMFYLHEEFTRRGKAGHVMKAFLKAKKIHQPLMIIPIFFQQQKHTFHIEIKDNPDNPINGTLENPLKYQCEVTLDDFLEPEPDVYKCAKEGCQYSNYYGVCRNCEDDIDINDAKYQIVKDRIVQHTKKIKAFAKLLAAVNNKVYNYTEEYIIESERDEDPKMIIKPPYDGYKN